MITKREHAIRGSFSLLAASVLLYMASENATLLERTRKPFYLIPMTALSIAAVIEANKVGSRVEHLLGLECLEE